MLTASELKVEDGTEIMLVGDGSTTASVLEVKLEDDKNAAVV